MTYDEKLNNAKFNTFFDISEWIRQQSEEEHWNKDAREKFDFVFTQMAIKYRNICMDKE